MSKGHCKHGEFDLANGCAQCIAETRQRGSILIENNKFIPDESIVPIQVSNVQVAEDGAISQMALTLLPGEDLQAHNYYEQGQALLRYAEDRVIATAEDLKPANDDLVVIAQLKTAMEAKRVELVKPMQDEVKAIQETYKTLMAPVLDAGRITRGKMTAFKLEESRKIAEAEEVNRQAQDVARKQAEMNNGEFTIDTTPVVVPEAPRLTRSSLGTGGLVANWKYRVINELLIPREYMMPNDAMLKSLAKTHHDNRPVPGIEFYNDPGIAVRRP
jgi:hypothetical protein